MASLITFGEITLDTIATTSHLRPQVPVTTLDRVTPAFGGRGATVALFASLRGVSSALVSAAGTDFGSSWYRAHLQSRGVSCEHVFIDDGPTTPKAFHVRDERGRRSYIYDGVIAARAAEIHAWVVDRYAHMKSDALYCTSVLLETNRVLLERKNGCLRAYAPGSEGVRRSRQELAPLLDAADCLFLNAAEARRIYALFRVTPAGLNRKHHLRFHVVTRGAAGSTVFEGARSHDVRACVPKRVVDETGAGDSYAGTFLAEYLLTGELVAAAQAASVVSSFAVEAVGSQARIPTAQEYLERLLTHQGS